MPTCGDFHIELYDIERKEPLPEYGHGYKGNSLIRLVPCETGRTFGVFVSALLPLEEHETVDFHAGIDIYIDGYSKPASSSGVLHLVDLPPEEDLTVTEVTGGIFINEAGEPVKTSWRFKEIDVADALDSLAIKAVPGNQPEDRDALTNQLELMRLQNESYDDVRSEPGQVVVSLHKLTGVTVEPWSNEDLPKAKKRTKKQKPVAGQSHYVTSSFQREDDVTDTMLAGEEGPELARVTFVYRDMKYLRARFTPAQLQQGLDGPTWSSSLNTLSTPSFTGNSSGLSSGPAGSATAIGASHGNPSAEASQAAQTPSSHSMTLRSRLQPNYAESANSDIEVDGASDDGSEYVLV